jgi:cytochrome b561
MMPTDARANTSLKQTERYGNTAIAFHWTSAVLVIGIGVLGLLHDSWPSRPTQVFWINIHAVFGLLLFGLIIARLWWRTAHVPPALPADVGAHSRRLSVYAHGLLYVLLLVIPVFGIVTFIWHGRVFDFGLFQVNPGVRSNHAIFGPTEDIHGYLSYALFALAGLHALAALWHHFLQHDTVLQRMWPSSARDSDRL